MKKISFIALLVIFVSMASGQWVSQYSTGQGTDLDLSNSKGLADAVDLLGNCYVTGYTYNAGTENDIFVVKYSPSGDTLWTRTYNGSENSDDQGTAIAVDNYGNVYVTGTAKYNGKSYEIVLLKYNSSGQIQWGGAPKVYGETNFSYDDKAQAIALDAYGNIYITGYSTGSDHNTNLIVMKYDTYGSRKWTKTEDGNDGQNAQGNAIAIDNNGNVVVSGFCNTYSQNLNILVAKYGSIFGNQIWSNTYNGTGNGEDKAFGIVTDDGCNIYVTGYATINQQTGNTDYVTIKYGPSGNQVWAKPNGGSGEDKAFGIVVDQSNSVYITGYQTSQTTLKDYVTVKYNADGTTAWTQVYNGTGNGNDVANAIGLLNDGNIVVTGASWGANNNDDYYTVKYNTTTGNSVSDSRYSLNGASEDVAKDVACSPTGEVFVTGCSELLISGRPSSVAVTQMILENESVNQNQSQNLAPVKFKLEQNFPNPFNPSTTINFVIPSTSSVKITVYDILGKEVEVLMNEKLESGAYSVNFTNKGLSSGIYFYELIAGSYRDIKKMTLVK